MNKYWLRYRDAEGKYHYKVVRSPLDAEATMEWCKSILPMYGCKFVSFWVTWTVHTKKGDYHVR